MKSSQPLCVAGAKRSIQSRRRFSPAWLALVCLLLIPSLASALEVPAAPAQWYNDSASLLDSSSADALNAKLRAFEQSSGAQLIMYVFPSLEGEALEDFTIKCAEQWKVGNKKYDNGLIVFVFVKEKKVRLEVGYGLEPTVTDAFSSDVIRNEISPHFKQGDFAGGLNAAADALIAKISGTNAPVAPVTPAAGRGSARAGGIDAGSIFIIAMIFLFFILPLLRRGRRGGRGGCGGCFWPLMFLNSGGGGTFGGGGFSSGGGWGGGGGGGWGGGGGGFSGGGGSFGGGGASGGW